MPDKSTNQRYHAKTRFEERFGFKFNRHVRREFVEMIQTCKASFVEKQSNRVFLYDIYYKGHVFRGVYDKNRKNIVTVLPLEARNKKIESNTTDKLPETWLKSLEESTQ